MAKSITPAEKLTALINEINERQTARTANIEKLAADKATAEKEYNAAVDRYNKAKGDLDAVAMRKAKVEKDAAADVLEMFTDALNAAERANAFTYDEIHAKYSEFSNINQEMTTEANKAICVLLAEIEKIVNKADKASSDLDTLFNDINNNTASCAKLTAGQLVQNMRTETSKARQHYAEYWPNK